MVSDRRRNSRPTYVSIETVPDRTAPPVVKAHAGRDFVGRHRVRRSTSFSVRTQEDRLLSWNRSRASDSAEYREGKDEKTLEEKD